MTYRRVCNCIATNPIGGCCMDSKYGPNGLWPKSNSTEEMKPLSQEEINKLKEIVQKMYDSGYFK